MNRYFVEESQDVGHTVEWITTDAVITDAAGNEIFRQDDVQFPSTWSQTAINIATSKYFCKSEEHKVHSWREVVDRICTVICEANTDDNSNYGDSSVLYDELSYLLLHQRACFNTPVMVNLSNPDYENQVSACFVLDVEDNLDSVLEQSSLMGKIFTHGSGAGIDLSTLRGEGEPISGGGTSSGVMSWAKIYDAVNASIKAGKIRRAASLYNLSIYHPDIEQFINIKSDEEELIASLVKAGYDGGLDGIATQHGWLQNANLSVRVDREFIKAVEANETISTKGIVLDSVNKEYDAAELLLQIAKGAWRCGDPGIIYLDNIAQWATVQPTHIGLNPCCEFISYTGTGACNLASINLLKYINDDLSFDIPAFEHTVDVLITAMDLLIDIGVYPTEEIEQAVKMYRPLGLGYSNLGATLMYMGLPYDSDEGRAMAALITALMTSRAYRQSVALASTKGQCKGLDFDRQDRVIKQHRDHLDNLHIGSLLGIKQIGSLSISLNDSIRSNFYDVYESVHGYKNTAVTALAPTGCVVGTTLITTQDGLLPIDSIGDITGDKWQDISLAVATDEASKLATKFFINGASDTRKITTNLGFAVEATCNHMVRVLNKFGYQWARIDSLAIGDVVVLLKNTNITQSVAVMVTVNAQSVFKLERASNIHIKQPGVMTMPLAYFLGYYFGNGNTKGNRCIRLTIPNKYFDELAPMVESSLFDAFGLGFRSVDEKTGCKDVYINSAMLVSYLAANNILKPCSYEIEFPSSVLISNRSILCAFIKGLFDADGSVHSNGVSISLTSESMIDVLQVALLSIGIVATKYIETNRGRAKGNRPLYILSIANYYDYCQFNKLIGFTGETRSSILDKLCDKNYSGMTPAWQWEVMSKATGMRADYHKYKKKVKAAIKEMLPANYVLAKVIKVESGYAETYDLSVPANVTYQANGLISHNTIGLVMDCDSTGIEPMYSLSNTKTLTGGGQLQSSNSVVSSTLARMKYDVDTEISQLPDNLRPVFATALDISPEGHLNMVAAVQPFVSMGISYTVNVPNDTTPEQIRDLYIDAWRQGVKSISVYRDGSKTIQPLVTNKKSDDKTAIAITTVPFRNKLPVTRQAITHRFEIAGTKGYITVGLYDDGHPGEIFLQVAKEGSTLAGLLNSFAVAVSLGLQHGVPLESYVNKYRHMSFEPRGFTKDEHIKTASSIVDYIASWLELTFLSKKVDESVDSCTTSKSEGSDVLCRNCGSMMVRTGKCYSCSQCGESGGCGS